MFLKISIFKIGTLRLIFKILKNIIGLTKVTGYYKKVLFVIGRVERGR